MFFNCLIIIYNQYISKDGKSFILNKIELETGFIILKNLKKKLKVRFSKLTCSMLKFPEQKKMILRTTKCSPLYWS